VSVTKPRAKPLQGRVLARNATWNFIGMATPMAVAIFAVPYLIERMGTERFGLLAIIWMGVGYFSLFDMGLGRALTKLVAERLERQRDRELGEIIWTALWLVLALGIGGMLLGFLLSEPFIVHLLSVPPELQVEGLKSFRILAAGIPVVVITSTLVGLLEAHQRFPAIAAVRIPLGVMTFLGPVLTVQLTPSLVEATAVLIAARMLAFMVYWRLAAHVSPSLKRPTGIAPSHLKSLLHFGGWLTVTNITGPLMVYFDRFFVGAFVSLTSVAYYVTPFDVLSRMQILPQAIMGVLFPAFSSTIANNRARLPGLYERANRVVVALMLPIMSGLFLFAPELLRIWLGEEFRIAATSVVHWLTLGLMINALAYTPFTVLQGSGRPDLVAKAHAAELLPYAAVLCVLTAQLGIAGTAMAWFLRALVDAIILSALVRRHLPDLGRAVRCTYLIGIGVLGIFFVSWLFDAWVLKVLLFVSIATTSAVFLLGSARRVRKEVAMRAVEPAK